VTRATVTRVSKQALALLCPILFALFPLLALFVQNQTDIELSVLWQPLILCLVTAGVLFGVFLLITQRAAKAGVAASLVVFAFFYFGVFFHEQSWWFVTLWLALLVVALIGVLTTRRDLANVTVVLGVAGAVLVVPQVARLLTYQADHPSISASDSRLWPTALEKPVVPSGARLPDIYVIIPDDYVRPDVLKQYFHYDDRRFVSQLGRRGFVFSEHSRSPYSDSESNVAALLNMDYLTNFPRVLGRNSEDVRPVQRVSEDNRAARLLKSVGYEYVHLDTDEVTFAGGNPDISPLAPPDSFSNLWLRKSILGPLGGPIGFNQQATDERFRTSVHSEFSKLRSIPTGTKPKFVVFHTLLPHDPYIFGARGQSVTYDGGSDRAQSSRAGRAHYVGQLRYVHRLLLDSIDRILAHAKSPPVIVLAADEGFSVEPEVFGEAAMQQIRVKGISALYLPGLDHPGIPTPPNSVNTLRFVFNHYLGTHYKMLDSASYPEGDSAYDYKHAIPVK
jgi:hypothetical protein